MFFSLSSGCAEPVVSPMISPAGSGTSAPNVSLDSKGRPILSWQRVNKGLSILEYSILKNGFWSEPTEVARGEDWFVNWADIPSVQPVTESFWAAHYLQRTPGGKYAYDVRLRYSKDSGITWLDAGSPHQDRTLTEHGFVSLFSDAQRLGVVWLDGREMATQEEPGGHDGAHGGMTLRSVSMDDEGRYSGKKQIDPLVCDCCQTAAAVSAGNPLVVYRDRTDSEIRDISSARRLQGDWTLPQSIGSDGWQINACPVNGPALTVQQDNAAVTWFSGADGNSKIFMARSLNGGESFEKKIRLDKGYALGRVAAVMYPDNSLFVAWIHRGEDGEGKIVGRYVSATNELGEIVNLVDVAPTRPTGFPKLIASESETVLAWTDVSAETPMVKTLRVKVDSLK